MAKIYTRRGDGGQTRLFTGERVSKDEGRLEALGCIDELAAFLGLSRSESEDAEIRSRLTAIQSELYLILGDIASAAEGKPSATKLPDDAIDIIESLIDAYDAKVPPLHDFIMPGATGALPGCRPDGYYRPGLVGDAHFRRFRLDDHAVNISHFRSDIFDERRFR